MLNINEANGKMHCLKGNYPTAAQPSVITTPISRAINMNTLRLDSFWKALLFFSNKIQLLKLISLIDRLGVSDSFATP